jgi:hypothetical protein
VPSNKDVIYFWAGLIHEDVSIIGPFNFWIWFQPIHGPNFGDSLLRNEKPRRVGWGVGVRYPVAAKSPGNNRESFAHT